MIDAVNLQRTAQALPAFIAVGTVGGLTVAEGGLVIARAAL